MPPAPSLLTLGTKHAVVLQRRKPERCGCTRGVYTRGPWVSVAACGARAEDLRRDASSFSFRKPNKRQRGCWWQLCNVYFGRNVRYFPPKNQKLKKKKKQLMKVTKCKRPGGREGEEEKQWRGEHSGLFWSPPLGWRCEMLLWVPQT